MTYAKDLSTKLASRNTVKTTNKTVLERTQKTMNNNTLTQPTKVLEIKKEHIKEFCKTASKADCAWVVTTMAQYMEKHNDGRYFAPFRMQFAKKFMPHLISNKSRAKKPSFLEELYEIEQGKAGGDVA
jgi:hypothetical protein